MEMSATQGTINNDKTGKLISVEYAVKPERTNITSTTGRET